MTDTLDRCPFCGELPGPIADILVEQKKVGRYLECRCGPHLYRNQGFVDEAHSRLETDEEMDANLAGRWNRRTPDRSEIRVPYFGVDHFTPEQKMAYDVGYKHGTTDAQQGRETGCVKRTTVFSAVTSVIKPNSDTEAELASRVADAVLAQIETQET